MTDLTNQKPSSIFEPHSHFMMKCRMAAWGLNVIPGRFICGNGAWFDHEFEPDCVRLKNHEGRELTILFKDLFKYAPEAMKDKGEYQSTPTKD